MNTNNIKTAATTLNIFGVPADKVCPVTGLSTSNPMGFSDYYRRDVFNAAVRELARNTAPTMAERSAAAEQADAYYARMCSLYSGQGHDILGDILDYASAFRR